MHRGQQGGGRGGGDGGWCRRGKWRGLLLRTRRGRRQQHRGASCNGRRGTPRIFLWLGNRRLASERTQAYGGMCAASDPSSACMHACMHGQEMAGGRRLLNLSALLICLPSCRVPMNVPLHTCTMVHSANGPSLSPLPSLRYHCRLPHNLPPFLLAAPPPDAARGNPQHTASLPPSLPPPLQMLHVVTPNTLLTTALSMLLETGISSLPVVDDQRRLIDVYARRCGKGVFTLVWTCVSSCGRSAPPYRCICTQVWEGGEERGTCVGEGGEAIALALCSIDDRCVPSDDGCRRPMIDGCRPKRHHRAL